MSLSRGPRAPLGPCRGRVLPTLGLRRAHLTWAHAPCLPRRGPVGGRAVLRSRDQGAGSDGALGKAGQLGAQVRSSTRARRRRRQHPSSRRRKQTRRCHCRCHLRATTGSPVRPGPPRSTPLSISGAPRRNSSLRGLTVGCSFRIRPRRPSARPGKPLAELPPPRNSLTSSCPLSTPAAPTLESSPPSARSTPLGEGERPRVVSPGRSLTGSKGGMWWPLRVTGFLAASGSDQAPARGTCAHPCGLYFDWQRLYTRVYTINLLTRARVVKGYYHNER